MEVRFTKPMEVMYKYYEWESFENGMYKTLSEIKNFDRFQSLSFNTLTDQETFFRNGLLMTTNWKKTCSVFLLNKNINRLAFIGQATCCYIHNSPELATKSAWKEMTEQQQAEANNTAINILLLYEKSYSKIHQQMEVDWLR